MVISSLGETTTLVVVCVMEWLFYLIAFMVIIANFHTKKYHKKIQELLCYWYITEALSGRRPWIEIRHLVNPKKTSAWNMKKRVKNGLDWKIQTESEAIIAAKEIFRNVAKPGSEFIEPVDLARFLPKIDALATLTIFEETSEGATTHISCSSLEDLMVYAFRLERSLVLSMRDTDSIISAMWTIVVLGSGITQLIGFVAVFLRLSDFVFMVYMFFVLLVCFAIKRSLEWNLIEHSIILFFFYLWHDVGERRVIDGVEMVVKKINFLSTTFVGLDKKEYQFSSTTLRSMCRIEHFEYRSRRLEKIHLILCESQGPTLV